MTNEGEGIDEFDIIMKVLDILHVKMETRRFENYQKVQITQTINQLFPGTIIGKVIEGHDFGNQGDVVMGDKYEAHGHTQIGAMGKGAKVTSVTFSGPQGQAAEADLASLVNELQTLRTEMRRQASTTEEDMAVVAMGQAIAAGDEGDSPSLFAHLKSAGRWAFDLATSIGAEVAAAVIRSALGLP